MGASNCDLAGGETGGKGGHGRGPGSFFEKPAPQPSDELYAALGGPWRQPLERGLEPALTFGGWSVMSKSKVKRMAARVCPACESRLMLHTVADESESGFKPRALQSLAALTRGFCKSRSFCFPAGQDV
jgi:hypothetical protein